MDRPEGNPLQYSVLQPHRQIEYKKGGRKVTNIRSNANTHSVHAAEVVQQLNSDNIAQLLAMISTHLVASSTDLPLAGGKIAHRAIDGCIAVNY
jgi:hypothetical protein